MIESSIPRERHGRIYTVADLVAMPTHLPSGDIDFELLCGKFIVFETPDAAHGITETNLLGVLDQCSTNGNVFGRVGIVLARNPNTVLAPDAAFIANARLPACESPEGFLEAIPDLVVEIRGRADSTPEFERKCSAYLAAGVRFVWVIDPAAKTVVVYEPNRLPAVFDSEATLAADEIFPGFRLAVSEIFSD